MQSVNAPIYLHADHKPWAQRSDPAIEFWDGETLELEEGLTLLRCGGHFEGSSILGPYMGFAPTGKPLTFTGITLFRLENGRIVEQWVEQDMIGFMRQLGAIPAPGQNGG